MSHDEIRNEKGLALLAYKEAQDRLALAEKDRAALARQLRETATWIEQASHRPSRDQYSHINPDEIERVLSAYESARRQLAEATKKKEEFGL